MSEDKPLDTEIKAIEKTEPKTETVAVEEQVSETETQKPFKSSGSSSFFSGLISLVSVVAFIAVGALGYFGYTQLQQMSGRLMVLEQQEKSAQSEAQTATSNLRNSFTQLQTQTQQMLTQQNASNGKQIQDISKQLAATRRQLQEVGGRHRTDWLLAEADYLARIASNRLLLERDHVTALVLLVSADERVMQMDDPALQPIREALARDMATLRLVKRADIAGLAIRISSLIPQLKSLPVLAFQLPEELINDNNKTASTDENSWQQNLKNTFKELSVKWFEVRDHGRPVTPLMAPETEAILLTNMTLLLQTTQFATLRQHPELYHHSLEQLKGWVNDYFDVTDPIVVAFINEIDLLNATSVRVELPKTLESRLMLARAVEQRLQQQLTSRVASGEQQ